MIIPPEELHDTNKTASSISYILFFKCRQTSLVGKKSAGAFSTVNGRLQSEDVYQTAFPCNLLVCSAYAYIDFTHVH